MYPIRCTVQRNFKEENLLNVSMLCDIVGTSRSRYYHWIKVEGVRLERENKDRENFELILKAYNQRGYSKGTRGIYMSMLHWKEVLVMNIKKIRRLMNKYALVCLIPKANPYRRMSRAMKTNNIAENLLNREFKEHGFMKDEINISECKKYRKVKVIIDDWIDYYNNERYKWQLAKLFPNQYY